MHRIEFEKFVVSIRSTLVARAASVVGDSETAEDVVQDCLFKMWSMRGSLDEYNSPEALALTITHRLALNSLRGRHATTDIIDEVMPSTDESPESKIIRSEKAREVNRVLEMLPDAQQALITMRHVEGLSNAEIAQIVGSSEGAVRTALSRARSRVAEIFMKQQLSNK